MASAFETRRRNQLIIAAAVVAVMIALPLGIKDVYVQNILVLTVMYAALSQAWNILSGYCGQISLGHALYFGIGAYASTLLFVKFGVIPWFGMAAGGIFAAAIALIVGWPCFRLGGHYFTIATIVLAEIGLILFLNWSYAGEASGLQIPVSGDFVADLYLPALEAAILLFRARPRRRRLAGHLFHRRFEMGLLLARRA